MHLRSRARRVREAYHRHLDPRHRSMVWAWASFATTFAATRAITHSVRGGRGLSDGGIVIAGRHIHHYNFGIALLILVGNTAVRSQHAGAHRRTAIAYGAGTALIVDEFALLLDLRDVYWASDGRDSVDLAVAVIALGGLYSAAAPFVPAGLRALRHQPERPPVRSSVG